jgi:hypothetical protein
MSVLAIVAIIVPFVCHSGVEEIPCEGPATALSAQLGQPRNLEPRPSMSLRRSQADLARGN